MAARQNVLVVSDVSAEQVLGGAERMLLHHIRALVGQGYRVTVLTRQPQAGSPLKVLLPNGVEEHRLSYDGHRGWWGLRQLRRQAKRWWSEHGGDFDVVIAEQPFTMWAVMQAGCTLPRLQVCHSFAFEEYMTRHGLEGGFRHRFTAAAMKFVERRLYASADAFLVLSDFMRDRLISFFGVATEDVTVVAGGVELPQVSEVPRDALRKSLGWDGPVVVTLRNLVPRTGVDLLVEAAALLRGELPQLRWCVIGQGTMLEQLQAQAAALGVAERIEFTGYLSEDEVRRRLFAADLFMLPTRDLEGFGLVTLEANACGLPVVATPVTANLEVVPSLPFNRLAAAVSAAALADAARRMLTAEALNETSRQQLRDAVEAKYAWRHHDAGFVRVLESIL